MKITKKSQISDKVHTMEINITPEQFAAFHTDNRLIQNIFPHLTPDEREFLMTGTTPGEWDELFGEK